jgi:hypothetical protein
MALILPLGGKIKSGERERERERGRKEGNKQWTLEGSVPRTERIGE